MTGEGGRLPVVLPPYTDERLSSWLARMAPFYAMSVSELLAELDLAERDVFDLEWHLSEGEGARIAGRTGLSENKLQAMTFREIGSETRIMIAQKNRHHYPRCPVDVQRKTAALPWVFHCSVHGTDLHDATGVTLPDMLGAGRMAVLEAPAKAGAAVLNAWARGDGQEALGMVEMLAFLMARHRRASPPNISEQPRMSLGARRDYHAFLIMPIIRQALTVVVPEYDQVAPVLAKPVRRGLHGLAQGSLLQAFALAAGIGRIVENPVNIAVAVLLVSDVEGQGRLKEVLKAWPLSSRRRISAQLWRAQRDERDRQITERAARRRQSHKPRRAQSHIQRWCVSQ